MPLRRKTLTIVLVLIVVLVLVLYSSTEIIVASNAAQAEEQHTKGDVERALNVLSAELSNLDTTAHDWATWDDTYAYVIDANPEYVKSNLVDKTFIDLKINLLLIVDSSGRIVFGKAFDIQSAKEVSIPAELSGKLAPNEPLLHHTSTNSSLVGVLVLGGTPTLVASRPILTSVGQGPIRGALIMGIFLNPSEISRLSEAFHGQIVVHDISDPQMPSDFRAALASLSGPTPIVIRPVNDKRVAGYALLDDIYGDPALILRIDEPRDFYIQSQTIMSYLALSLLVVCVTFGAVTLLSLEKLVLSPLTKLNADVSRIASRGDRSNRVSLKGGDEFSSLATTINVMLKSREQMEEHTLAEHDLALELATTRSLDEALSSCLETAIRVSGMDCGGIYLIDPVSGDLDLAHAQGLSNEFVKIVSHYEAGSDRARLFGAGKTIYTRYDETGLSLSQTHLSEGLRAMAIIPILHEGRVIACFNVASHRLDEVPLRSRSALETIAAEIGNVVARIQAEESLRESENRYRTLFDSTNDAILIHDMGRRFLEVNRVCCELFGYSREELLQMTPVDISSPEYAPLVAPRMAELRQVGHAFFETAYVRRDGTIIPIELSTRIIEYKGKPAVLSIARDITERKKAEGEIRKLSQFLESIIDNADVWLDVLDEKANVVIWNKAAEVISGYSREEVTGHSKIWEWLYPDRDYREQLTRLVTEVIQRGRVEEDFETRIRRKDGQIRIISWNERNLLDEHDKPIGSIAIGRDVTERKQTEEALRTSEMKYRTLVANIPHGIYQTSSEGKLLTVNPALVHLLGYDSDTELLAVNVEQDLYANPEDRRKWMGELERRGEIRDAELVLKRKDGSKLTVLDNAHIVRDERGAILYHEGTITDITERKRMEDKIRRSEASLTNAQRIAQLGNWDWNIVENILYWSDEIYRIFGLSPREFGATYEAFLRSVHPDDRGIVQRSVDEALYRRNPYSIDHRIVLPDGSERIVHEQAEVTFDKAGRPIHMAGTVQDITERKRMEEELRRSRQFLETLIDTLPDPVYLVDRDYRHVMVNEALARLVGLPREKVIGKTDYDLYPKEVAEAFRKKDEEFFEKGVATEVAEETLIDAQGKTHIMHTKKSPLRDSAGNVTHLLGVTRDITRRKQMEQELERYSEHLEELVKERTQKLAESEQRFRELANLLPQIVFETDEEGNLTFGNQAGFAATGYAQQDIDRGMNVARLFVPEQRGKVQDRIKSVLGGERSSGSEYIVQRKDGSTFPVITYVTAIVREDRPVGLRGIAVEITERKRMEEQLLKAERFAAIGETVMMVGHDLRNPLQVMVNSLALWEEISNSMPSECRSIANKHGLNRLLERVERQLEYMNKIVSDLQDYARPVKPELARVDVLRFIRETLSAIPIPENTKVIVNSEREVGEVMLDPTLMKRVLTNLITNAIQAMPSGGALSITVSRGAGFASIDLEDTGVGISEENLAKVFQPLFTTKPKGQGLGLPVCKRLVEAHGGNITVKSKVGVGTTFTVNLPSQ